MELLDLPNELLLIVAENVERICDVSAFSRTNRLMHALIDPHLYKLAARGKHKTALHWAARLGELNTLSKLLDAGADIEAPDSVGYTALDMAARGTRRKGLEIVQILIQRGANLNGGMA